MGVLCVSFRGLSTRTVRKRTTGCRAIPSRPVQAVLRPAARKLRPSAQPHRHQRVLILISFSLSSRAHVFSTLGAHTYPPGCRLLHPSTPQQQPHNAQRSALNEKDEKRGEKRRKGRRRVELHGPRGAG
eukprot:2760679-Rhodomonas_salina.1